MATRMRGEGFSEFGPEETGPNIDGPMDDEQFRSVVKQAIQDAEDYIDGNIAPQRELATRYYRGDPFGNEETGRSQIVMTEVRDVSQAIVPSLLRIFTASDRIVEYAPRTADKVAAAEQATDYVNLVFYGDNPGFSILNSVFKDAVNRKTGIIKWRWSTDTTVTESDFTDLTQGQLAVVEGDPTVEILERVQREGEPLIDPGTGQPAIDPATGQPVPIPALFDVRIRRKIPKDRAIVEAVPPEEFIVARNTRDLDTSDYLGHRSQKTVSQLVAMGYDKEEVEEGMGAGDAFGMNTEAQARNPAINPFGTNNADPSMKLALYVESYIRVDKDGDGIAELRKVCSLGQSCHILHDEVITDVPIAFFCPDPEPHMLIGQSVADQVMDLQRIKSSLVRSTLDSLAQSIFPTTAVVEHQVNMDDVLNTEMGKVVRMKAVGAYQPMSEPFVGQAALPILAWFDQLRAQRTGISPASQGLDPDVLQSTTQDAVTATVSGAQERIELIARIFAETGMKRLFKGLLRLTTQHQDKPRLVRLRGKFVEVDPRTWDSDLDVTVDVALGRGTDRDKMNFLTMVASKQEQIIQTLGADNPICGIVEYGNTLSQICNLAGFKEDTRYFKKVDAATLQQHMANKPPPPPDPNMMLVQIEQQKVQQEAQSKGAKLQLDQQEAMARAQEAAARLKLDQWLAEQKAAFDRARLESDAELAKERMRLDAMLKLAELEATSKTKIDVARFEGAVKTSVAHADRAATLASDIHGTHVDAAVRQYEVDNRPISAAA